MRGWKSRVARLEKLYPAPQSGPVHLVRWAVPDEAIQAASVGGSNLQRAEGERLEAFEDRVAAAARSAGEAITWMG